MANKISVVLDLVTDKAVSGLKGFKASINDADGAVGKFKAGSESAFGAIKAHAAQMALAAGAALVAFGAKGVAAFTDLALEAGKFRDVSGSTLDEASRWIAVGDDIGVSGDAISGAWNKMNIAIGSGKPLLKEYGIELKRTADGQADANATFLNAIDTINGIQDPTKKAEVAAATFGKGWTSMSELIEQGSGTITKAMDEVSDAQIIDDDEVAKAKEFRASMDKLGDSIKDLAMDLGEELTPAVTVAADTLAGIAPAVGKVAAAVGGAFIEMSDAAYTFGEGIADLVDAIPGVDLSGPLQETLYEQQRLARGTADLVAEYSKGAPTMEEFIALLEAQEVPQHAINLAIIEYRKILDETAVNLDVYDERTHSVISSTEDATEATDELTDAEQRLIDKTQELTDQYAELKGELSAEEDFLAAELMWGDLQQSAVDSYTAASEGAEDATEKANAHRQAVIDAKQQVVEMGEKYKDIPKETITRIVALIDAGQLAEAERQFAILTRNRTMNIDIVSRGGPGYIPPGGVGATGGIVTRPTMALIGEAGPEAVVPLNQMPGASPLPNGVGGGSVNITVNAGMGADGRRIGDAVVDAIKDFERRNGTAWRR